jgi:hypothetical protein
MKTIELKGKTGFKVFSELGPDFYKNNPHYRGTDASIEKLLLLGPTAFHDHASVKFFAVEDTGEVVGRFALIHDAKLQDFIQVSFFEAFPNLNGILDVITSEARKSYPGVPKIVVGLNGHLNYGAGLLIDHFVEDPVFGLPYSNSYYPDYFSGLNRKVMVTFRFAMSEYIRWFNKYNIGRMIKGVKTRNMEKKNIKKEFEIYTRLNNLCFKEHPYWADRTIEEDLELFYPFRHLLKNENLIFAEYNGEPIGFFLWYPDFNQLVKGSRDLNVIDVLRYKTGSRIDTFRFAEIGILPKYRRTCVNIALIQHAVPYIEDLKIDYCESGFIFEENKASITMMRRFMNRFFGEQVEPYRHFALYEGNLY